MNQAECDAFRGSGGLLAMASVIMPAAAGTAAAGGEGDMPSELIAGTPISGDPVEAKLVPVEEFVTQIYFEGLPLDTAARYGKEVVPTLLEILSDPRQLLYHENVALTLGMIGLEDAVEPLVAYLRMVPEVSAEGGARAGHKGRVGAIIGLGYLANRAQSETALAFLIESTSPAVWEERALEAMPGLDQPMAAQREDLSKYAILALGLSGDAKAREHLEALQVGTSDVESAFVAKMDDVVSQSLELNEEISQKGLLDYYSRP